MKIEYIRNIQSGYMRIELGKSLSKTEEKMLERNRLEGILPVCQQTENGKCLLRYDITGLQAFDVLLENTMADETILKSMLVGICVAVKQLEKHLLWQDGLLLVPEAVFWDARTQTAHFCYYPEAEESLQVRLRGFMEYMLAKTNHKNVQAVQLVYGIYELVQKPSFCIKDMQEYLLEEGRLEKDVEPDMGCEEAEPLDGPKSVEKSWKTPLYSGRQNSHKYKVANSIMSWIKERIKRLSRRKEEQCVVSHEVEHDSAEWTETRMLNVDEMEAEGVLKYEGINMLPNLVISNVPFTIGSGRECEGVINYPTISRYHARITNRDGVYFVEDLNSTNGTRVNGGLLSYKTRVSLKKNDSVYFANEPYRFF